MRVKIINQQKKAIQDNLTRFERRVGKCQTLEELKRALIDFGPVLINATKGGRHG